MRLEDNDRIAEFWDVFGYFSDYSVEGTLIVLSFSYSKSKLHHHHTWKVINLYFLRH